MTALQLGSASECCEWNGQCIKKVLILHPLNR